MFPVHVKLKLNEIGPSVVVVVVGLAVVVVVVVVGLAVVVVVVVVVGLTVVVVVVVVVGLTVVVVVGLAVVVVVVVGLAVVVVVVGFGVVVVVVVVMSKFEQKPTVEPLYPPFPVIVRIVNEVLETILNLPPPPPPAVDDPAPLDITLLDTLVQQPSRVFMVTLPPFVVTIKFSVASAPVPTIANLTLFTGTEN